MEATVMSEEIEREIESTRPRENPALPVPAIRRASAARPPHACDPMGAAKLETATHLTVSGGTTNPSSKVAIAPTACPPGYDPVDPLGKTRIRDKKNRQFREFWE